MVGGTVRQSRTVRQSLDAESRIAVRVARATFNLPYLDNTMGDEFGLRFGGDPRRLLAKPVDERVWVVSRCDSLA